MGFQVLLRLVGQTGVKDTLVQVNHHVVGPRSPPSPPLVCVANVWCSSMDWNLY